jgi:polysaccharide export outer membrane protein
MAMTSALLGLAFALAQAPAQPARPPAPPSPALDARPAGAASQDYRIGPGDILRITVYGHEDLSQTVIVQPSGTFVFPLLGSLVAAEATPAEVEALLVGRLSKGLIRDPQVTVAVQEYRSKVVYVVGEVARPGTYPLAGETRIVEILSRAGPVSPNAGSEVVVVRPAEKVDRPVLPAEVAASASGAAGPGRAGRPAAMASAEVLRVDVSDIQAGQLDKNLLLKANDTVFVPQAARIFVTGEVRAPGAFAFTAGMTLRQAVSMAGGFTADASKKSARVVRDVGGKPKAFKIKLDEPLRPGDTVEVKAKLF